jgi:hypothetical protein
MQILQSPGVVVIRHVIYEYACHEGNYAMKHVLSATRAAERTIKWPLEVGNWKLGVVVS